MNEADANALISAAKLSFAHDRDRLEDWWYAASGQAHHLESSQRARLMAGAQSAPNHSEMREVVRWDRLADFLEACMKQPLKVADRLRAQGRAQ